MTQQKGFSIAELLLIFGVAAILIALLVTFIIQTDPANKSKESSQDTALTKPDVKQTYSDNNLSFEYPSHLIQDKSVQGSRVFKTSDFTKEGEYITKGYSVGYTLANYIDYPEEQFVGLVDGSDCDDFYEKCEKVASSQGVEFTIGNLKYKKTSHNFGQEIQAKVMSDGKLLFVFGINVDKDAKNIEQALTDLREIIASLSFEPKHTFENYQ